MKVPYSSPRYCRAGIIAIFISIMFVSNVFAGPLENWTQCDSGITDHLWGITYGDYRYVAVGDGGKILTSDDGSNWRERIAGTVRFRGVAYGNNIFVTVGGPGGLIMISYDGVSWQRPTAGRGIPSRSSAVSYIKDKFIVWNGAPWFSEDGTSWDWVGARSGVGVYPAKTVYGNNMFVAIGAKDSVMRTSVDGKEWTSRNTGISEKLNGLAYGNNMFVAVGDNGTVIASFDGINWVSKKTGITDNLLDVTYGDETFITVGENGAIFRSGPIADIQRDAAQEGRLSPVLAGRDEKLRAAPPEDHGMIIIPEQMFPQGKGNPIEIFVPPVIDGTNAFFNDWKVVTEISGRSVRFSRQKLLENLSMARISSDIDGGALGAGAGLTHAAVKAFSEAFEREGFKITLQENGEGDFRAVIQILTDDGNVIIQNAGGVIQSPNTVPAATYFSEWLKEQFSLPDLRFGRYAGNWVIDKRHKGKSDVAYLSLNPAENAVVITPKTYPDDKFVITRTLSWSPVLEIDGDEYVSLWTGAMPAAEFEDLKVLELVFPEDRITHEEEPAAEEKTYADALVERMRWREYNLGSLSFSIPSNWKVFQPDENSFIIASPYRDRRFAHLMVVGDDIPKGLKPGTTRIIHSGTSGGRIVQAANGSQTFSISHMGRLVDSFLAGIARQEVKVLVLELTEQEGIHPDGIDLTMWSFTLYDTGKRYIFTLSCIDSMFQDAIFRGITSRIKFTYSSEDELYENLPRWLFGEDYKAPDIRKTADWKQWGRVWEDAGLAGGLHTGIDYAAQLDRPIFAAVDGRVIRLEAGADCNRVQCTSTLAIYNENKDVTFIYVHARGFEVKEGDVVKSGDLICRVGSRGLGGPHLHFEARAGKHTHAALDANATVNPYEAAMEARQTAPEHRYTEDAHSREWLKVPRGQLTFDLEGTDPVSLTMHAPPGKSGVTIGRGYDIGQQGNRAKVLRELIYAGIPPADARRLADAFGLTGGEAREFVRKNRHEDWATITREQQHNLFNRIYPVYYVDASNGVDNASRWGILFDDGRVKMYPESDARKFDDLPAGVQSVATDMVYNVGFPEFRDNNWGGIFQMDTWQEMADYIEGNLSGSILDSSGNPTGFRAETILQKWRNDVKSRVYILADVLRSEDEESVHFDTETIETGIPQKAYEAIFKESSFAEPYTLRLPCEDDPAKIEELKRGPHNLAPAFIGRFTLFPRDVISVLIQHGYMDVEQITVTWSSFAGSGSEERQFPKYTDKIAPYIDKITIGSLFSGREIEFTEAGLRSSRKSPNSWMHLRLASRVLKSIDYENIYEEPATSWSSAYEVVDVKFSYKLNKEFPRFEDLASVIPPLYSSTPLERLSFDKVYYGEARAYYCNHARKWELERITLGDRGY